MWPSETSIWPRYDRRRGTAIVGLLGRGGGADFGDCKWGFDGDFGVVVPWGCDGKKGTGLISKENDPDGPVIRPGTRRFFCAIVGTSNQHNCQNFQR